MIDSIISLRYLNPGQNAVIVKVTSTGILGCRLRDMGVIPGASIIVIGRAPLKDPVEIKIKGYNLTLRNDEADHILVKVIE